MNLNFFCPETDFCSDPFSQFPESPDAVRFCFCPFLEPSLSASRHDRSLGGCTASAREHRAPGTRDAGAAASPWPWRRSRSSPGEPLQPPCSSRALCRQELTSLALPVSRRLQGCLSRCWLGGHASSLFLPRAPENRRHRATLTARRGLCLLSFVCVFPASSLAMIYIS